MSARGYALYSVCPQLPFFLSFLINGCYCYFQNIVIPLIFVGAFSNGINAVFHYIFLFVYDFGTE